MSSHPAKSSSSSGPDVHRILELLRKEGGIDPAPSSSRGFGRGLRVNNRVFAMPSRGELVLKFPRERVDELVAAGIGVRFDRGHGRIVKEWIVPRGSMRRLLSLAREARDQAREDSR